MTGGITAVKNTLFDGYLGPRMPREIQLQRVRKVIEQELSECQRKTLVAYYYRQLTIPQIAQEQGVNKSTVCRTLHRAENRIRRFLRF